MKNKPASSGKYIFGPVPSRRLGLSLGVDIVPFKTCPFDCVYCQLGRTTIHSLERKNYTPIEDVLAELASRLNEGIKADYITISGSGEPTLHSKLGKLIDKIKKLSDIPVAIITNAALLTEPEVRADCAKADLIVPSLDAVDESAFTKINRPCGNISAGSIVTGLEAFRNMYKGRIWLEVFIIEGVNTDKKSIEKFLSVIELIRPDKIQLNTVARPTADINIKKTDIETLEHIKQMLGPKCEIVADVSELKQQPHLKAVADEILALIRRRPCSLRDICNGLGLMENEVIKHTEILQHDGKITTEIIDSVTFYKST